MSKAFAEPVQLQLMGLFSTISGNGCSQGHSSHCWANAGSQGLSDAEGKHLGEKTVCS